MRRDANYEILSEDFNCFPPPPLGATRPRINYERGFDIFGNILDFLVGKRRGGNVVENTAVPDVPSVTILSSIALKGGGKAA